MPSYIAPPAPPAPAPAAPPMPPAGAAGAAGATGATPPLPPLPPPMSISNQFLVYKQNFKNARKQNPPGRRMQKQLVCQRATAGSYPRTACATPYRLAGKRIRLASIYRHSYPVLVTPLPIGRDARAQPDRVGAALADPKEGTVSGRAVDFHLPVKCALPGAPNKKGTRKNPCTLFCRDERSSTA